MSLRVALVVALVSGCACDAIEKAQHDAVDDRMKEIEKKVARDQVEQYEIAKRGGDEMQICVQAGLVKAAFLQAKDEPSFKKWSDIEEADCEKAGLPR